MIKRFNRFELKYLLPVTKASKLMETLAEYTQPDSHGFEGSYMISSLYYDSPQLDCFWDKIEGIKFRRKVRIRVYPQDSYEAITDAMVEIKQRINRTVQKRRLHLPLDSAVLLCEGKLELPDLDSEDAAVASEVSYLIQAMHQVPACIIEYQRKAFVGNAYNPDLRITFDTHLKCRVRDLQLNQTGVNRYFLPPDWCIMEVKVNDTVPDWVSSLLQSQNCELTRVSKYCAGLALAHNLKVTHQTVLPPPQENLMGTQPLPKRRALPEEIPETRMNPLPDSYPAPPKALWFRGWRALFGKTILENRKSPP